VLALEIPRCNAWPGGSVRWVSRWRSDAVADLPDAAAVAGLRCRRPDHVGRAGYGRRYRWRVRTHLLPDQEPRLGVLGAGAPRARRTCRRESGSATRSAGVRLHLPVRTSTLRVSQVPPAGFEPALPPPEAGKTLIMPVFGVDLFRFPGPGSHELPWCPVVHCTNPCTSDGHRLRLDR
jgi:hypothetical protein